MSNADITQDFIDAWETMDVDKICSYFTDDAVYTNIPMDPPNRGIEEIRAFIAGFIGSVSAMKFTVHRQMESADGTVMNERTDRLDFHGNVVDLPVMGVFEFRDGKISAWRDYFDMAQFAAVASDS